MNVQDDCGINLKYCVIGDFILIKLQGHDNWIRTHCKYLSGLYMIYYVICLLSILYSRLMSVSGLVS